MLTPALLNTPEARRAGAVLTIDLDALVANWQFYADKVKPSGSEAAAVVKAQSYGLDAGHLAPALAKAGCETFYVATVDEGILLRNVLGPGLAIHVLNGLMDGAEREFIAHNLVPVLNSLGDIDAWRAFCNAVGKPLACCLHVDTGMSRLGLDEREFNQVAENPEHLAGLKLAYVLSHLAISEEPDNPYNARQLSKFKAMLARLPRTRASFANSSGVLLGPEYHFDQVRPGVALYGVNPTPHVTNPMKQVVRLQAKILQTRTIDTPQGVGYGATHQAVERERIATIATGYADGYPRSLSSVGDAYIGELKAPIIGRISMDLTTIDVTHIPEPLTRPGQLVDLIGPHNTVDDVAAKAGTVGYEILTSLGARYHRIYVGGEA
jgi:alanine racemase